MNRREKIIGITMISVIAIWAMMYLPKPQRQKAKIIQPVEQPRKGLKQTVRTQDAENLEKFKLEKIIAQYRLRSQQLDLSSINDPFQKLEPKKSRLSFSDLVLSGIIWDQEQPMALINNQLLKKGDAISDFKIEEIKKDEVILIKGMERYTLKSLLGGKIE